MSKRIQVVVVVSHFTTLVPIYTFYMDFMTGVTSGAEHDYPLQTSDVTSLYVEVCVVLELFCYILVSCLMLNGFDFC